MREHRKRLAEETEDFVRLTLCVCVGVDKGNKKNCRGPSQVVDTISLR